LKIPKISKGTPSNAVGDMGWYAFIMMLADGKFKNINPVLRAPISEAFMYGIYNNRSTFDQVMDIKSSR